MINKAFPQTLWRRHHSIFVMIGKVKLFKRLIDHQLSRTVGPLNHPAIGLITQRYKLGVPRRQRR